MHDPWSWHRLFKWTQLSDYGIQGPFIVSVLTCRDIMWPEIEPSRSAPISTFMTEMTPIGWSRTPRKQPENTSGRRSIALSVQVADSV